MANEEQQQLNRISKDQRIAEQLGLTPELLEPRESAFSKFFNFIDKPKQAVVGLLDSALIRGDISKIGIPGAIDRAWEERANTFDILRREKTIENPILRGLVGFTGEVLLDPLNAISFGAEGAAKYGLGKSLSLTGTRTAKNLEDTLAAKRGLDAVDASYEGSKIFDSIAQYSDLAKKFKKEKNTFEKVNLRNQIYKQYDQFKEHLPDIIPNAKEYIGSMDKAYLKGGDGLIDLVNIVKNPDHLGDIFAKKTLDIGLSVPFVGHLTGRDAPYVLDAADGVLKKTAKMVGNFIKPDKISVGRIANLLSGEAKLGTKVGEKIPETIGQMFDQFTMSAAKGVSNLKGYLKTKPVIGKVVEKADLVGDYLKQAKENLYSVFNIDKQLNPKVAKARQEYLVNGKKAAWLKADKSVREILGEDFINPEKIFQSNHGGMIIDQAQTQVLETILAHAPNKAVILDKLQNAIQSAKQIGVEEAGPILNEIKGALKNLPQFKDLPEDADQIFENLFKDKLNFLIKDSNMSPDQVDVINRAMNHFANLKAEQNAEGITSGTIDFYLPHMIENLIERYGEVNKTGSGRKGFLQARKYSTLTEAFREGGYLGNSDLASIIFKYTENHHNLINEKRFLERYLLETQSDPKLLQSAWKAAHLGDNDAYEFLKFHGADLSDLKMTDDKLNNLLMPLIVEKSLKPETLERLRKEGNINFSELKDFLKGRGDLPDDLAKYLNEGQNAETRALLNKRDYRSKLSPEIQATFKGGEHTSLGDHIRLSEAIGDFTNETLVKAKAMGVVPSQFVPLKALGSPAVEYVHDGKSYMLFPQQAKALEEIRNASDPIKQIAKGNPFLESVVEWSDWASHITRSFNTVPWLAFHVQNLIGTKMQRAMGEGWLNVLTPGLAAEVRGVLNGTGAIKTIRGMITPKDFEKILINAGMKGSNYEDYIGVVRSLAPMNLEKLEKRSRSAISNLKKLELKTLFNKGTEVLQDRFENFARINHLAYELKRGSSVPDAINATNKLLFNYRDLSRVEASVFRRLYMFYPWTKKATAQTLHMMYTRPGTLSNQIRAARGFSEMFSDPNAAPTLEELDAKMMTDIVGREEISFPLGTDSDGKTITGKFNAIPINTLLQNFTINIPRNLDFSEILGAADESFTRTIQKQAAQANPIFKAIAEKMSGKNMYFDKPLDTAFLRTVPKLTQVAQKIHTYPYTNIPTDLIDAATVKFLDGIDNGKGGYVVNPTKMWLLTNFVPGLGRAIATANRFSNEKIPLPLALTHFLTGIRVSSTDAQRNRYSEVEANLNAQLKGVAADQQLKNMREGL